MPEGLKESGSPRRQHTILPKGLSKGKIFDWDFFFFAEEDVETVDGLRTSVMVLSWV